MSDRTQYEKNLRAVATACKNYVDETKEQILWQVGQYDISTQDDNTTAYQKIVPTGATRAKIKSIGGMSYKSENLIVLNDVAETTVGTLIYSISNGVLTLNGKGNGITTITNVISSQVSKISASYTLKWFSENISGSGGFIGLTNYYDNYININDGTTAQSNGKSIGSSIQINSSSTFTNAKFKPMLVSGSTAPTEFKQGFTGIRDSIVTSVKSYGANLFDIQNATYSSSDNWNITTDFWLEAGKTYTIKSNATAHNLFTTGVAGWGNITNVSRTFTPSQSGYLMFGASDYNWYPHLTEFKQLEIMLNYGSTAIPYKPYRGLIDTFTIPDEVKALDGWGVGINENCYNYLDLVNKKFIQKCKKHIITAQQQYLWVSGSYQFATINVGGDCKLGGINIYANNSNITKAEYASNGNIMFTFATAYESLEALKQAMIGVIIVYELATLVETDISEYIDNNVIEVEEGGYLVFENEFGQAVPSNITYRIEVAR